MPKMNHLVGELLWKRRGILLCRPNTPPAPFAPAIGVRATVSVEGLADKFVIVDCLDYANKQVSVKVARADFLAFHKLKHALESAGYEFPRDPGAGKMLHDFIINLNPRERWHLADRTGWHGTAFVLPNLPAATEGVMLRYEPDNPLYCAAFEKRGSLEGWQSQVADHARYSNRMVFTICLAFAAPLMHFAMVEPGGFHLFGKSTKGKSVCLIAASSVTGPGTREDLLNWDITDGGLEEVAAGHNHSLLCLDETGQIRTDAGAPVAKKLRAHAFKLAGGRGRLRSSLWGQKLGARDLKWRLLFLSTGELSLSEIAAEADLERLKGEEVRLIDLPASNSEALGIYEELPPECASLEDALAAITDACAANCGFPFEAYIGQLQGKVNDLTKLVSDRMNRFMAAATVPTEAWERRFAQRFALAFAAGSIAADFGVVPWTINDIGKAVRSCYWTARQAVPDVENLRDRGLAVVRTKLQDETLILDLRRSGHNVSWTPEQAAAAQIFRRSDATGTRFIVGQLIFENWFDSSLQAEIVLRDLERRGLLVKSDRGLRKIQISIAGIPGKPYYYCISGRVLTGF